MPRKKLLRRFEPRYGISAIMIDEESKWLGREVEDHELLAIADVEEKRGARQMLCEQSWKHLRIWAEGLPRAEKAIIDCLIFRDFYHILELYLHYLKSKHPEPANQPPPDPPKVKSSDSVAFSEWLFKP